MAETTAPFGASGAHPAQAPSPWFARHRWTAALVGGVLLTLLGLIASSVQFAHHPTGVAAATATPTQLVATSTPPAKAGFTYYTETVSGFQTQYPTNWEHIPQNPGVEFDDSAQNPTYILQILVPTEGSDSTTDWVQYEMNNLRQNAGTTGFQQTAGTQQAIIGGVTWTGGAATLQQGTTTIAVQVYATVHKDRAYIINMLAANTSLEAARAQYFNSILDSFNFLA
jgi:hypothetical protein